YVAPQSRFEKAGRIDDYEAGGNYHLILLATNREGYQHLCRLVTAGYQEGFHYKPRVDKELLRELNGGLIALSGCLRGEVAHSPEDAAAHEVLLCIQTGKTFSDERRWKFETDQLYVKDAAEMAAAFADVPEAVANTLDIARRCDLELTQQLQFPVYRVPEGESLEAVLERDVRRGLDERLNEARTLGWEAAREREYEERARSE